MRISIPTKPFATALARCAAIADNRASMPILSSVLLTPGERTLRVDVTDLEVGYSTVICNTICLEDTPFGGSHFIPPAKKLDEADEAVSVGMSPFTLPAKKLHEIVKSIPVDMVDIQAEGNDIYTISGGTASFTLTGLSADEYPGIETKTGDEITVPAISLHQALAPVAYCQAKDETKYNLCGVFLRLDLGLDGDVFLTAVATDGHRLCVHTHGALDSKTEEDPLETIGDIPPVLGLGVILPSKAVAEILRLQQTGPAVLCISGGSLVVSVADERLTLRLIDGDFPDFTRVVPDNPTKSITVKRQPLLDALERVRIITVKEGRGFDLSTKHESIYLKTTHPGEGREATDRVTCDNADEIEPMRINIDYLYQALSNITSSMIELLITSAVAPILVQPHGSDSLQAVIMPMRGN